MLCGHLWRRYTVLQIFWWFPGKRRWHFWRDQWPFRSWLRSLYWLIFLLAGSRFSVFSFSFKPQFHPCVKTNAFFSVSGSMWPQFWPSLLTQILRSHPFISPVPLNVISKGPFSPLKWECGPNSLSISIEKRSSQPGHYGNRPWSRVWASVAGQPQGRDGTLTGRADALFFHGHFDGI